MDKSLKTMFKSSCIEFTNINSITISAMLIGISVILGYFSIQVTPAIKIGFAFLPIAIGGYLYGPVVGAALGGATDILNFILKPTGPFHPGFTFSAILTGFVFGLIYYKRSTSIPRIAIANVLVNLGINTFLNSYWLIAITKTPYSALLATRVPKELIMLVINGILYYLVAKALQKTGVFHLIGKRS